MKKLVVLKLDGDFNRGFSASLEIGEDGKRADIEFSDNELRLPPIHNLPHIYQEWCRSYRGLDGYRIKPKKGQVSNVKFTSLREDCLSKADNIKRIFTNWLQADSFRRIKEECLIHLSPSDEIRFIIRTTEFQLRKLPWHLWDLFDSYPDAEIALSCFSARRISRSRGNQFRILIVLGNSEGINVAEDEKLLKAFCQDAELVFLTEPSILELNEYLWDEKGWDILFFSGHSRTEAARGVIYINSVDALTIEELKEGLKTAVRGGLQLAFFNSCDGLGIAAELECLHIPQIIVMREPVPDRVANQFLKYFFQEFTGGKSLYKSVNVARRKLQGLEKKYPCASWLPVIVQNLLEIPPTWQSLGAIANCPYLGLAAFKEEDAVNFFGRDFVRRELFSTVNKKSFVAVVGASGCGKSSVVFAGLIPGLREDKKRDWLIVNFRPGNNPFESLAIGLLQGLPHLKSHFYFLFGKEKELEKPHPNPLLGKEKELDFENHSKIFFGKEKELEKPHPNPLLGKEREPDFESQNQTFLGKEKELEKPHPNPLLGKEREPDFENHNKTFFGKEREPDFENHNKTFFGKERELDFESQNQTIFDKEGGKDLNSNRLTELELEVELKNGDRTLEKLIEPLIFGNQKSHLIIIVDQFEELYTLCHHRESRHVFIDNLLNLIKNVPGCKLIITLRADFYAEALSYRPLANALQDAQVNLAAMDEEELQAVIEKPANNYNVSLQEGLSQRLIDAVVDSPSNLPLLEFTLTQLWEKQQDGFLTHQAYEEIGGVETALANHGEAIYNQLSLADRQRVQQIFIQLVQPWERSTDIRRLAIREEVENWDLISRLADGRLVVTNRNQVTGVETVEIIHEALIKNWRRLQKWMREDGDFRCWQEQLRVLIKQWENSNQDDGALLRGKLLIDAEEWLLQRSNQISSLEARFINFSLDLRNREEKERKAARQRVIIGLTGGLIAALLLAGFAGFQWRRAEDKRRESEINQIKSLSLSAKSFVNSGNHVEALSSTLVANKMLIALGDSLEKNTRMGLLSSLLENLISIREYNRLIGHDAAVSTVAYSDDGRLLASGSRDNRIRVWRGDGKLLQILEGHQDGVFSVVFSPENQYLIAGSFDNRVSLWRYDSTTGLFDNRPFIVISEPDELWAIAFNSKNNIIATANENGKVKFWTLKGKLINTIPAHNQKIWGLNFSPDGNFFASASADNTIKIWDSQGRFLKTLVGHSDEVLTVEFSSDNKKIISGSKDNTVKLWHVTGKLLHTFTGHSNEVLDVRFSRNGKLIASASADDRVRVWNVALQKQVYQYRGHGGKAVEIKFSPDDKTLAMATADNAVKLKYLQGILPTFAGNSVSISPDGKTVAIANQKLLSLRRRDGSLIRSFDLQTAKIIKVIFSPTGKFLATIDKNNQIKVWSLQGKLLQKWRGHDVKNNHMPLDIIRDISISADGEKIATIGGFDQQVKLWNQQGKLIRSWQLNHDLLTSLKFSPDGKTLAIAGDKTLTLWDIQGNLLGTITAHKDNLAALSFNSDGRIIATASNDKTVKLWQSYTGKLLQTLTHQDNVYEVTFSSDNQFLMTGSKDKTLNFWSLDGKLLNTIKGYQGGIKEVEFSGNNMFASVDINNNVILWNLDINELQQRGCDWLQDYLMTNVEVEKNVCD